MKISIVILNYKGLDSMLGCLESIRDMQGSEGDQINIIVVDNASNDGSREALVKLKGITFIENKENLGYAGGNNVGIKEALLKGSDFILLLNNDTFVDKELIAQLVISAKKADIIAPKIYFARGYEFHKSRYQKKDLGKVIWYAGGEIDWENVIGIHLGVDVVDNGQFDKEVEIELATGACIFIKREVFEKIGLLDEKYFLYLEDMDFCTRARRAGFKILFSPRATVWHKNASASGGSGSSLQDYFITRNRLLFAMKYTPLRTKIAVIRQVLGQLNNPVRRKAFFDFLTFKFGKGSYL